MSVETDAQGTRLTLDLWHPNCWAIQATADNPGGILAHAVYDSPTSGESGVNSLFTAYGESEAEVEALLEAIDDSPLTETVRVLHTQVDTRHDRTTPGRVSREFFLEHDPSDMICPLLLEHGFVHSSPGRIEGGREHWNVRYAGERSDIEAALDAIREEGNAEVEVERIGTVAGERNPPGDVDALTPAQREAFELARERGYYEWPRETSTRDLADELGVSKTTLLEHLRTAESKLLDP
jgi:predicted DNA binding protein